MKLNTASQAISFARKLEQDSGKFYEELAAKDPANAAVYQGFVKENKRYVTDIERAYYGVITDAIEGCFSFDLEVDKYSLPEAPAPGGAAQAAAMEEMIVAFYREAAEQSRSLMCDVPRAFEQVMKKRAQRIAKLKSLAGAQG